VEADDDDRAEVPGDGEAAPPTDGQEALLQARRLQEDARRLLDQAWDEAAELRAAAVAESARLRDRATSDAEDVRNSTRQIRAAFSRFLEIASRSETLTEPELVTAAQRLQALLDGEGPADVRPGGQW
jgi:hypothetical protein